MSTRAARQIREGILLARQTLRHERLGPFNADLPRLVRWAFVDYLTTHRQDYRDGPIVRSR